MTTRARDRKLKEQWQADVESKQREVDALLDILNAILFANGGTVVIAQAHLHAAQRREVTVMHGPKGIIISQVKTDDERAQDLREQLWTPGKAN